MSIDDGGQRALYRPLNQEGHYSGDAHGCHRGHMEVLNVRNARPGFRYYYHPHRRRQHPASHTSGVGTLQAN